MKTERTRGQTKSHEALKQVLQICFIEKPSSDMPGEGVGLLCGALVHWTPKGIKQISLKRSVALVAKMTRHCCEKNLSLRSNNTVHVAWLQTVSRSLGSHAWGDC
jgi:hypothetical protein